MACDCTHECCVDHEFVADADEGEPNQKLIDAARRHSDLLAHELNGAQGTIMGLSVTAGFFERRCEVLEKLLRDERLTDKEQEALVGCCPLVHRPHVVCRGCGLSPDDYALRARAAKSTEGE